MTLLVRGIISSCLLLSHLPSISVRADNAWGWEPSISLADNLDEPDQLGFCLDISGFRSGIDCDSLQTHSCKEDPSDTQFEHDSTTNTIRAVNYDSGCNVNTSPNFDPSDRACVTVTGNLLPGATLGLTPCNDSSDDQIFEAKPIPGGHELRAGGRDTGLCLAVSDTTRSAGPYVARDLFIAVCSSTDNELKTWTVSPTPLDTSPTSSPLAAPSAPSVSGQCVDSALRFKVPVEDKMVARSCEWVARKKSDERCAISGVSDTCSSTCGTCGTCSDSPLRIKFLMEGETKKIARSCEWVARTKTDERCAIDGMSDTCRETCGKCQPTSSDVPTRSPIDSPTDSGEVYIPNPTGDISYLKMENRNPDCTSYIGDYFATINDIQENSKLEMSFNINFDDNYCIFSGNNIPNHDVGGDTTTGTEFSSEVLANVDDYVLRVPRNPAKETGPGYPVYVERQGGKLTLNGIMLNGVDLDMDSAFCYDPAFGGNGIGLGCLIREPNWFAIPAANPDVVTLDEFTGHSYRGRYHYHGDNDGLSDKGFLKNANIIVGEYGSPVIGFAPDGFPIYGHYFYDAVSDTVRMPTSSWRIKENYSNGRQNIGTSFASPSIEDHPLGIFEQDWEYVEGSGDLDQCNGLTDAFGNYGYYYTEGYPYGPLCTYGEPNDSFTKESCEYNAGGAPCRQFSFITYSKQGEHDHDHEHGHGHEHGSHKARPSVAAQALFSVSVLLIVTTSMIMISTFNY